MEMWGHICTNTLPLVQVLAHPNTTAGNSLYRRLQQGRGEQRPLATAAAEGREVLGSQVRQQQLGASVQKVQRVLRHALHRGVSHLIQIKYVLQEVQHLLLQTQHAALVSARPAPPSPKLHLHMSDLEEAAQVLQGALWAEEAPGQNWTDLFAHGVEASDEAIRNLTVKTTMHCIDMSVL